MDARCEYFCPILSDMTCVSFHVSIGTYMKYLSLLNNSRYMDPPHIVIAPIHMNDRAGFSEGDMSKDRMREGSDFQYFSDYYGKDDYAHRYVEAAFEGKATQFDNGNADFSHFDMEGKERSQRRRLYI